MRDIFTTRGVPPKIYQSVLTKEFGPEWTSWLPETLYAEIARVWGATPIPEVSNKLGALKVFLTTDVFYHDAAAFEHVVHAVNDLVSEPDVLELSMPSELMYALLALGPIDETRFGSEIIVYIRVCCEHAGLLVYPTPLKFAQPTYQNAALQAAVGKITPTLVEGPDDDIVAQQSSALYRVVQQTVDKLAAFNTQLLEQNT